MIINNTLFVLSSLKCVDKIRIGKDMAHLPCKYKVHFNYYSCELIVFNTSKSIKSMVDSIVIWWLMF